MPAWSPDGQTIAYYYSIDQTETSNLSPWVVNAHDHSAPRPATSSAVNLTCWEIIVDELHNYSIGRPQWFPDSQSLLVTVQERAAQADESAFLDGDEYRCLRRGAGGIGPRPPVVVVPLPRFHQRRSEGVRGFVEGAKADCPELGPLLRPDPPDLHRPRVTTGVTRKARAKSGRVAFARSGRG